MRSVMIPNSKTQVQSPTKNNNYFYRRQQEIDTFLVKSYRKPSHLLVPHSNSLDYGTLNQYKLDDLINFQSDGFNQPKIIRLAFVDHNSIHLEEEAIQMFQKYVKNQISFIAVYGKTKSGKSLLLDKLINLCEFTGTYFTNRQGKEKGLYLWSVPFSKGNLKIFLIDIDGYTSVIDNSYFMLLDFMMLISSVVLFLAEPQDYAFDELATIYKHVNKSRSRFKSDGQLKDSFWPNNIYCLFRRAVSITKGLENIIKMFNQFNFTVIQDAMDDKQAQKYRKDDLVTAELKKYGHNKKIISQEYIKRISGMIRDIMLRIETKSYMNLRYTGANLIKLTINTVQYLNLKGYLKIDKIFHKSMKELYIEAYNFHTQMYNETLIEYLNEEEPMQMDYLLKAFQNSSDQILRSFNGLKVNQQLKEQYAEKLEKYINEKQKMVLEINKKKSKNKAKVVVPELPPKLQIKELAQFVTISKKAPKNYEQVYVQEIGPQIAAGYKYIDKNYKDDDKELRQKSIEYQRKIEAKSKQLEEIKRNKSIKSSEVTKTMTLKSNFEVKQKKLNQALKTLKSQYQESKLAQPQKKNNLKASKSVEFLKAEELALKREKKQRERIIQELKSQSPATNKELISHLQSKISERINKQRDLQNMLTSQMRGVPTVQVLKSTTSLSSQRKVQSRVFDRANSNIRIIPSPKA